MTLIKNGGLAFSAALTMSLFLRLFGFTPFGIMLSIVSLILFEGGAVAWERQLEHSQGSQRGINYFGLWFSAIVSVLSSGLEIILFTQVWTPNVDLGFITVFVIVVSLSVNILGAIAWHQADPDMKEINATLDQLAADAKVQSDIENSYHKQAAVTAKNKARKDAGIVVDPVSDLIVARVQQRLLGAAPQQPQGVAGGGLVTYSAEQVDTIVRAAVEDALKKAGARS